MALVPIHLEDDIYKKIQRLAVLAGSESAAIERLVAYWENSVRDTPSRNPTEELAAFWRSPTGDLLRVGERLEGIDTGKTHFATVEQNGIRFSGKLYDSPSAAARAVKRKRGLIGPAASTNGRDFWKLRDPQSGRLVSLSALRPHRGIDAEALLANL